MATPWLSDLYYRNLITEDPNTTKPGSVSDLNGQIDFFFSDAPFSKETYTGTSAVSPGSREISSFNNWAEHPVSFAFNRQTINITVQPA